MTTMTVVSATNSTAIDALLPSAESSGSSSDHATSFSSVMADQQARTQTTTDTDSTHSTQRQPTTSQAKSDDVVVDVDEFVFTDTSSSAEETLSDQFLGIAHAVADGWNNLRASKDGKLKTSTSDEASASTEDYGLLMTALPTQPMIPASSSLASAATATTSASSVSTADIPFELAAHQDLLTQPLGPTTLPIESPSAPQSDNEFQTVETTLTQPIVAPLSSGLDPMAKESQIESAAIALPTLGSTAQISNPQRSAQTQRSNSIEIAERNRTKDAAADSFKLHSTATSVDALTPSSDNVFTLHAESMEPSVQESGSNAISAQGQTSSSTTANIFSAGQLGSAQSNPVQSGTISATVGSSAWTQELNDQILQHTQWQGRYALNSLGQQQIELSLNPADLGPLHIVLSVNDGVAQASFTSAHATVRDSVETALPQLQQALANAGLTLGQANVGADQSDQQHAASDQASRNSQPSDIESSEQPVTVQRPQRSNSLLDTFA